MIGIDEAQVDALLARLGEQHAGAARHVQRHGVEEGAGRDLVTEGFHRGGEDLGEAVGALGHPAYAVGPVVDGEHGGDDGEQDLGGADVAGRLLATDVLLAGLERHAQGGLALAVDGNADDAAGHDALELVAGGEEGGMRSAEAHGHAEALRGADGDVGAELARRDRGAPGPAGRSP